MRVTRYTFIVIGLWLFSLPLMTQAVGLGPIGIYSALGQPLDTEIPLLDAKRNDVFNLKVYLADAHQFPENAQPLPGQLRFRPVLSSTGQAIIHVTTQRPVTEPYIKFVVKVLLNGNQFYREYTILLDPYGYQRPRVPPARLKYQAPAAANSNGLVDQAENTLTDDDSDNATNSDQIAPATNNTNTSLSASLPPVSAGNFQHYYGPTHANDTLYSIAREVKPSHKVTLDQTLMAIFIANPTAFVHHDTDQLKVKQRLVIPDEAYINAFDPLKAQEAAQQHGQFSGSILKISVATKPPVPSTPQGAKDNNTVAENPLKSDSTAPAVTSPMIFPADHLNENQLHTLPPSLTKILTPQGEGSNVSAGATPNQLIMQRLADTDHLLQHEEQENQTLNHEVQVLQQQNQHLQKEISTEQHEIKAIQTGGIPAAKNSKAVNKPASAKQPEASSASTAAPVSQFDQFGNEFFPDKTSSLSNTVLIVLSILLTLTLLVLIIVLLNERVPFISKLFTQSRSKRRLAPVQATVMRTAVLGPKGTPTPMAASSASTSARVEPTLDLPPEEHSVTSSFVEPFNHNGFLPREPHASESYADKPNVSELETSEKMVLTKATNHEVSLPIEPTVSGETFVTDVKNAEEPLASESAPLDEIHTSPANLRFTATDDATTKPLAPPKPAVAAPPSSSLKFASDTTAEAVTDSNFTHFEVENAVSADADVNDLSNSLSVDDKIDLAQTYFSMGDKEGARELLLEAIKDGTEMQRAYAQSILDQC